MERINTRSGERKQKRRSWIGVWMKREKNTKLEKLSLLQFRIDKLRNRRKLTEQLLVVIGLVGYALLKYLGLKISAEINGAIGQLRLCCL